MTVSRRDLCHKEVAARMSVCKGIPSKANAPPSPESGHPLPYRVRFVQCAGRSRPTRQCAAAPITKTTHLVTEGMRLLAQARLAAGSGRTGRPPGPTPWVIHVPGTHPELIDHY